MLDLIRPGQADTQADLCRLTGANSSTMTYVLDRLRQKGLVRSSGQRRAGRGKRSPSCASIPADSCGTDIDGAHARVGIMDDSGHVVASTRIGFPGRQVPPT